MGLLDSFTQVKFGPFGQVLVIAIMKTIMKIVVIGAGSASFGRGMLADILLEPSLDSESTEVWLVDLDPKALDRMASAANKLKQELGSKISFFGTADRTEALPGADFVLIAVSVRRMELWEQDYRVPAAYGVKHVLGENGGPGAVFHTMRSLKLIIPVCQDIERLCPKAWVLNFTNPEARVLHAMLHLTKVKGIGLCHGVFWLEEYAARLLNTSIELLELTSAGMNHAFCAISLIDKSTGKDRLPELLSIVQTSNDPEVPHLFKEFAKILGMIGFPSDDHVGEYFAFGSEFHGDKWVYGLESRVSRDEDWRSETEKYLAGEVGKDGILFSSGELAIPIIKALQSDKPMRMSAVDILNDGGYVENLPRDIIVEVPATVSIDGVEPIRVGSINELFAVGLRTQYAIHGLLTEAYRTRKKDLLLQALVLDPCMHSIQAARKILDDMLELQKDYLPEFD